MSSGSWDGFLKGDLHCKKCGEELSGQDGMHPDETYAGSYTGLCKDCENEGPYVVEELFDGAKRVSHPPVGMNSRRGRHTHIGYDDCEECDGDGMNVIQRRFKDGGNYGEYCEACLNRYHEHPLRKAKSEMLDLKPTHHDWEDDFQNKIEDIDDEDVQKEIAKDIHDKVQEDRNKIHEVVKKRFNEAKDMDEEDGVKHIKNAEDVIKDLDLNKEYW